MSYMNDMSDDGMGVTDQERQVSDWNDIAIRDAQIRQRNARIQQRRQRQAQAVQMLGGFGAVIGANQQQRQQMANMKNDVLSSMYIMARKNNGFVPPEVLGSVSRYLGKEITGAGIQNGKLVITSPSVIQDPKTGQKFTDPYSPFAEVGMAPILKALQNSCLATDMQSELYGNLIKGGMTPQELTAQGIVDPNGVQEIGGTTDGKATARLTGNVPSSNSRISVYASDGKGGTMSREYDGHTGADTGFEYGGNWDPDGKGTWSPVSVGPSDTNDNGKDKSQVRVYENSKTGERVSVKDGENLRDVLAQSQVVGTNGKRGTLGLRNAGTRTASSGTGGMTAEERTSYMREQEKLRTERELAVQDKRNDGKAGNSKPTMMTADLYDRVINTMRDKEAMKNPQIAAFVNGVLKSYNVGDGTAQRPGVSGSLDEATKEGDRMNIDQFTKEEQDMIKNAPMPEGWVEGETAWKNLKKKDPLAVLRHLNVTGRQLDGGEQNIEYTDENGNRVIGNGFRDKAGRIYGVRHGADGKNYRGNEIKTGSAKNEEPTNLEQDEGNTEGEVGGVVDNERKRISIKSDNSMSEVEDIVKKAKSASMRAYGVDSGPAYDRLLRTSFKNKGYSDDEINNIMSIIKEEQDVKDARQRESSRIQRMDDAEKYVEKESSEARKRIQERANAANDENSIYNTHERMTKDGNNYGNGRSSGLSGIQKRIDNEEAAKSERMRKAGDAALAKLPSFDQRLAEIRKRNIPIKRDTTLADIQKRIDEEERIRRMDDAEKYVNSEYASAKKRIEERQKMFENSLYDMHEKMAKNKGKYGTSKPITLADIQKRIDEEEDDKVRKQMEENLDAFLDDLLKCLEN